MSGYQPVDSIEAPSAIEGDLLCASCGYNLRGLTAEMQCPECGAPAARSIRGDFLRYGDPQWMRKIATGTSLLRWSILVSILLPILGGAMGTAIAFASGTPGGPPPMVILLPITVCSLTATALWTWAAFLITAQEPRVALQEDPVNLRIAVRYTALIAFVGQVLSLPAQISENKLSIWLRVVGMVLSLASLASFLGLFIYFRRFALRLPDASLADSTRTVMWGFVISYALLLVGGITAAIAAISAVAGAPGATPTAAPSAALLGGGLFVCIGVVGSIVFAIWTYRLLLRYVKAFRVAAQEAGNSSSWAP